MPWWAWVLIGLGVCAAAAVAYVVFLAALFSEGDNPK